MKSQRPVFSHQLIEKDHLLKKFEKHSFEFLESEKCFEYTLKGSVGPTIVLINGENDPIERWLKIWSLIENDQRIFSYQRIGLKKLAQTNEIHTRAELASELRNLLCALEVEPPYLLVGHSGGGVIAYTYASKYPNDICGVVFLESPSTGELIGECDFPQIPITVIAGFQPMLRLFMPKNIIKRRLEKQQKLLMLSEKSEFIMATKSGQYPQHNEPKLVAQAILNNLK